MQLSEGDAVAVALGESVQIVERTTPTFGLAAGSFSGSRFERVLLADGRRLLVKHLPLLERLDSRLRILTGGPRDRPERHQSLASQLSRFAMLETIREYATEHLARSGETPSWRRNTRITFSR